MEETAQENLKLALEPFWTFVCDVEGDLVGYVTDDKQVQRVMLEYEKATLTQYFIYSSESFPRLKLHTLDLSRKNVRFVDRVVHTAGVPFVTISAMIRLCSRGGTYRCTKKSQNERERKSRKNVKVGCTSKIYVKQVLLFPEFKESDTLRSKSQISDSVKEEMKNGNYGTICYFISFPSLKSHCNHSIDKEGSAQTKRIDKRLVEELKRLVNDKGIVCDEQLQVMLIQFVEREINPVPSRSDAAYFPALSIIRNHRTKFLKSRGDPSLWLNSVRFRKMNKALIVELRRLILTENIVCTSTLVERLKRYVDLNIHPQPNENDKAFYPSVVTVRKHKSHILHQSEKMAKDGNDVNIPTTNPPVDTTEPSTLDTSSLIPTTRETCEGMLDPDASPLYLTVPISYPANTYTEVPPLPPLPPEPPEICRDTMPPDEAPAYHNMISQYENIPAVDSIPADIQLFAMTATPSSQNATSTITQHCELSMPVGNELLTHQSVIVKRDLVYDQPMDLVTEHSNVIHTLTDANAHKLASARLDTVPCMQTDAPQEHVIPHVHINPQGTSCHSVEDQNASQEQNIHAIPDPDVAPACGNTQITQNVDVSMQPAGQAWKNTFQDELLRCYELAISSCTIISDKEGDSLTKELQELRVKLQSLTESDVTNVVNRDMHVNPVVNRDMHVNPVVNRDMHVNPPTSAHSGPAQQSTSSIIGLCTATQPRHNKSMTKQTVLVNHETSKAKRRSRRQVSVETSPRRTRKLDTTSSSILTNLIKKHNIV